MPFGKSKAARPSLRRDLRSGGPPAQAPCDHQMHHQPEIVLEAERDPFPEPAEPDYALAEALVQPRRVHGAEQAGGVSRCGRTGGSGLLPELPAPRCRRRCQEVPARVSSGDDGCGSPSVGGLWPRVPPLADRSARPFAALPASAPVNLRLNGRIPVGNEQDGVGADAQWTTGRKPTTRNRTGPSGNRP